MVINAEHTEHLKHALESLNKLCEFEAKQNNQENNGDFIASYLSTTASLSATVLNNLYGLLSEQLPEGSIEINSFLEAFMVTLKRNYSKMYKVKLPDVEL